VPSSIEETALAVEVLLDFPDVGASFQLAQVEDGKLQTCRHAANAPSTVVNRGLAWLVQQIEAGGLAQPTPIGFYFAKLWYFERLYPIIFSVAALGRARRTRASSPTPTGEKS
jgi:squalene-hopene/tetraprenyl-beta-curcumene cyclase